MALYKKEILVRQNSTATYDQAITATRGFVNGFQVAETNLKEGGGYTDFFFADCFDARNGNIYRVFSDACTTEYAMPNVGGLIKYTIIDNSLLATKAELTPLATKAELTPLATKAELTPLATKQYVDDAISNIDEVDLTTINNSISDHEIRITSLEESGTSVYVIE